MTHQLVSKHPGVSSLTSLLCPSEETGEIGLSSHSPDRSARAKLCQSQTKRESEPPTPSQTPLERIDALLRFVLPGCYSGLIPGNPGRRPRGMKTTFGSGSVPTERSDNGGQRVR